ncbi:MAG: LacI family DNA-binding transcriptional regulator [Planctomycetota bacterium]
MPPKPTLKDVAKLAGCSTAIVSTVVNGSRRGTNILASAETQKRVRAAAKKLNYHANYASRSLARNATQTIGLYIQPHPFSGLGYRYEGAIIQGIEHASQACNYDLLAINLSGGDDPSVCTNKFAEKRIDGLILMHVDHEADWVDPLVKQAPNVVAVNYYGSGKVDRINFDDQQATGLAVKYLHELGHRRIGFIGSRREAIGPGMQLRMQGFRSAMTEIGLEYNADWIWSTAEGEDLLPLEEELDTFKADARDVIDWLKAMGDHRPTAFVAYNDLTAVHLMRQCQSQGLTIPSEMSIVGIDGAEVGELVWPALTSIRQPFAEMGKRATELVIERAEQAAKSGKVRSPRKRTDELFAPEIIPRSSTRPADANT